MASYEASKPHILTKFCDHCNRQVESEYCELCYQGKYAGINTFFDQFESSTNVAKGDLAFRDGFLRSKHPKACSVPGCSFRASTQDEILSHSLTCHAKDWINSKRKYEDVELLQGYFERAQKKRYSSVTISDSFADGTHHKTVLIII